MPSKSAHSVRNPHGPRADAVIALLACDEGSGTTFTNKALARFTKGNATLLSGSTGSGWGATGYNFATEQDYLQFANVTGDYLLEEWTISLTTSNVGDNTINRPIFSSSQTSSVATTHATMLVQWLNSSTTLRLSFRDSIAGVNRLYDWTGLTRANTYTLIIRGGGPGGIVASLDGAAPNATTNDPTAYKGPLRTENGTCWAIGRSNTNSGLCTLHQFVAWDKRLTDAEVDELVADPYLMSREWPGGAPGGVEMAAATTVAGTPTAISVETIRRFTSNGTYLYDCLIAGTTAGGSPGEVAYDAMEKTDSGVTWGARIPSISIAPVPWCGRAKSDGCTFRFCTSAWMQTASAYFRVKAATAVASVDGATPVASAQITTAKTSVDISLTGLSSNTLYYWQAEWSTDNTNWYPFPCGIGTFRTMGGEPTFGTFSDCHTTVGASGISPSDLGQIRDIVYSPSSTTVNTSGTRSLHASARTSQHIADQTPLHFLLLGGDHAMVDADGTVGTADTTPTMWQRWRSFMSHHCRMLKRQVNYLVLGNHEGECGYRQLNESSTKAMQKQAFNVRRAIVCNPDSSTYTESGEAHNSSTDWVGSSTPASFLHSTSVDLENYYAFTWGSMTLFVLDSCRYSDVGDATDSGTRTAPYKYAPGAAQLSWFATKAAACTSVWKIAASHYMFGGVYAGLIQTTGYYARGSGIDLNQTEPFQSLGVAEGPYERSLHTYLRAYGFTQYILAHNHKDCDAVIDGVYYTSLPTAGAPSHTTRTRPGWTKNNDGTEWSQIQATFGTPQSGGTLDASGNDLTAKGMISHFNTIGWKRWTVTSTTLVSDLFQTVASTVPEDADTTLLSTYTDLFDSSGLNGHGERHMANMASTPSTNAVNLATGDALNASPLPSCVYAAYLDSAITGAWYDAAQTNKYAPDNATQWAAGATYAIGAYVYPLTKNTGYLYRASAITTGVSDAAEPTFSGAATDWPTTIGSTLVDNGVTWTCVQRYIPKYRFDENLQSGTCYVNTASDVRVLYVPRRLKTQSYTQKTAEPSLLDVSQKSGGPMRRRRDLRMTT